jgi:hypothetical protein
LNKKVHQKGHRNKSLKVDLKKVMTVNLKIRASVENVLGSIKQRMNEAFGQKELAELPE